nr:PREDICTED: TMV resistance protein N-like isoform X2 [Daucus carota subsp. sativus]
MDISKEVVFIWALPVLTVLVILAIIILIVSVKKHCPSADTTSDIQLTDSSCSSSSSSPPTWDVFLSFHGKDTRSNFTSHLYHALCQAGIQTFIDDHALEKGQEISSTLLDAIRNSDMFIVVLSENYAGSRWCLDELAEILSCKRTEKQVVPVFYYVDPSDVGHQKGSFGKAFDCHKKRYSVDKIKKWKSALSEIAKLSGHHLRKEANERESETIQKIVGDVAPQASTKALHLEKYLFGIESAVEEIYQKLRLESNDVRAIGVCGMGGIGKTTIAKAFYNLYFNQFDISCFSASVKQYSPGGSTLLQLLQQLLIDLLRNNDYKVPDVESGIRKLKRILHSKKALIVLDDLDCLNYSELLANIGNLFSAGSKIVITTRDANLLDRLKADISEVDTYMVKTLGQIESLKLFSYHAFRNTVPPESFKELSLCFATHAGGLPLALKVLGSSLFGRTHESFWKDKLEKVKAMPEDNIQKILQLSYDELKDETEKAIFLDIAFFFIGKDKDEAFDVFKSCGFFPGVGIPNLVDRCLLTVDKDNKFEMHNLIQDMGRKLGKTTRTRLFLRGNERKRLFLRGNDCKDSQNLEPFKQFNSLGCLYLSKCGDLKRLPEQLGEMKGLKMIDVSCTAIEKLPDSVTYLKKLIQLNLRFCKKLTKLPEQLGDMKGLKELEAGFSAITRLPDSITQLKELFGLDLYGCKKLRNIPEHIGNLENLRRFGAGNTAIEQLPDSFVGLINLETLNLNWCKNLRNLPDSIWKLKLLKQLYLGECRKLERLPEQLGEMQCLEHLDAHGTSIKQVPDSIRLLSRLQVLNLGNCKKLEYVPKSIWNLTSVGRLHLEAGDIGFLSLPDSVEKLNKLTTLHLNCNVRLCLPMILRFPSLEKLFLTEEGQILSSAEPVSLSHLLNLRVLALNKCTSLGSSLPELPLNLEGFHLCDHSSLEQLPDLSSLQLLERLDIQRCISLKSISLLPRHLLSLSVEECTSLQDLPDLSMLKELEYLRFTRCSNLKSITLKQSILQGARYYLFTSHLPNREVAEWFDYRSSGHTVSFDIPPSSGSNFLGLAIWLVYTCEPTHVDSTYITAVISNKTESITANCRIHLHPVGGEAESSVQCIRGEKIPVKSGDRVKVTFGSLMYCCFNFKDDDVLVGEVKVKMCGVHVIQD